MEVDPRDAAVGGGKTVTYAGSAPIEPVGVPVALGLLPAGLGLLDRRWGNLVGAAS